MPPKAGSSEGSEPKLRGDGRYEVVVYIPERTSVYGRTPREVRAKARDLLNKRDTGVRAEGTVGSYVEDFLEAMPDDPTYSPTTCERYAWDMSLLPSWLMDRSLEQLRKSDVQKALNQVLATPTKHGKPRAASTVNKVRDTLAVIIQTAVDDEMLLTNPVRKTRPFPDDGESPEPLTDQEWATLRPVLREHRLWTLFLTAAVLGLRESECIGLRWSDLSDEGVLRVFEQDTRTLSGKRVRKEAKAGSKREIKVPAFLLRELLAHRREARKWALRVGQAYEPSDLIWTSQVGTPLGHRNLLHMLHRACKRAGIRRISFHTLRHSAGTIMLEAGIPERTIMDILGHRNVDVSRKYQRVRDTLRDQAADELNRRWEGMA